MTGATTGLGLQLNRGLVPKESWCWFKAGHENSWTSMHCCGYTSTLSGGSGAADGGFGLVICERSAGFISRVKELQEEKVILEARLTQLCGGARATVMDKGGVGSIMELEEYREEVERLVLDTVRLQRVLDSIRTSALHLKARYDVGRGIRCQLEAGIAAMKKDIEKMSWLQLVLEAKRNSLWKELNIIQHEMKTKQTATLTLLCTETEITVCRKELQALLLQLQNLMDVNRGLRRSLAETRSRANSVASRYEAQIAELEAAIEAAKYDLHEQIIGHKELLDMKLALNAEIATYWALLDGEELSFPLQSSRSSSSLYLSESPPTSSRSSSPLNPVQTDIAAEARSESPALQSFREHSSLLFPGSRAGASD